MTSQRRRDHRPPSRSRRTSRPPRRPRIKPATPRTISASRAGGPSHPGSKARPDPVRAEGERRHDQAQLRGPGQVGARIEACARWRRAVMKPGAAITGVARARVRASATRPLTTYERSPDATMPSLRACSEAVAGFLSDAAFFTNCVCSSLSWWSWTRSAFAPRQASKKLIAGCTYQAARRTSPGRGAHARAGPSGCGSPARLRSAVAVLPGTRARSPLMGSPAPLYFPAKAAAPG